MSLENFFSDIASHGPIVISHVIGSWLAGRNQGCHCSCHLGQTETDSRVLDILQHQLERCGPENLSHGVSSARAWVLSGFFYLFLIATGFAFGWVVRDRREVQVRPKEKEYEEEDDKLREEQRALRIKLHGASAW